MRIKPSICIYTQQDGTASVLEDIHLCCNSAKRAVKSLQKAEWLGGSVCPTEFQNNLEEDHHHHHHPGSTEILSISILKVRYYAQKICAGFLEILCTTWGEKLRALICPGLYTAAGSGGIFPWKGKDREVLPFFWTLGLQNLQEILKKRNI